MLGRRVPRKSTKTAAEDVSFATTGKKTAGRPNPEKDWLGICRTCVLFAERQQSENRMSQRASGWSAEVESTYQAFSRELWALLYAQCCDSERAYDAVQESFVRLQRQNGTPIQNVRGWLLEVGRNWLLDTSRRRDAATGISERLDRQAGSWLEPHDVMEKEELRDGIRNALRELRIEDREVLVLRYALGWSARQMATALDLTSTAVDMRLSRARIRLGAILEKAGISHERV